MCTEDVQKKRRLVQYAYYLIVLATAPPGSTSAELKACVSVCCPMMAHTHRQRLCQGVAPGSVAGGARYVECLPHFLYFVPRGLVKSERVLLHLFLADGGRSSRAKKRDISLDSSREEDDEEDGKKGERKKTGMCRMLL